MSLLKIHKLFNFDFFDLVNIPFMEWMNKIKFFWKNTTRRVEIFSKTRRVANLIFHSRNIPLFTGFQKVIRMICKTNFLGFAGQYPDGIFLRYKNGYTPLYRCIIPIRCHKGTGTHSPV